MTATTWPVRGGPADPIYIVNGSLPDQATDAASSPARDGFGRLRVASPQVTFADSLAYGLSPLVWETRTSGAGNTATWSSATRGVTLTLASAGYVVRQTYLYLPYQPGRSQLIMMTGVIGPVTAGVTRRIGQFDATNGLYFQQGPTGLAVVRRSSTTGAVVDVAVPQSGWNLDRLDGSGPSGAILDPTRDQIWVIDYGWLGTATVRWGVYIDGVIVYVHAAQHANVLTTSYMQTATLPLRYELSGTGAAASMLQICTSVASEGGYIDAPAYTFAASREIAAALSTASEAPIIAIRPALTLGGIPNRVRIRALTAATLALAGPVRWALRYYPPGTANPITGGAFAVANTESAVEVNAAGTAVSLAGSFVIDQGFVGSSTGGSSRFADAARVTQINPLTLDMAGAGDPRTSAAGANPAYLVLTGLGTGATAAGNIDWEEVR